MAAQSYASLDDVKAALRIPNSDTVEDALLRGLIATASRKVDEYCHRYFGQVGTAAAPVSRVYRADEDEPFAIHDLVTLTDIGVDYTDNATTFTSLGASVVHLLPKNAATEVPARPYTALKAKPTTALPDDDFGWVQVTGVFGWPAVPDAVVDATVLQTVRLYKSRDVPLGLVGGADGLGGLRLPRGLHPDAAELLTDYVRLNGFA